MATEMTSQGSIIGDNEKKNNDLETKLTSRSRNIIKAMDTDGDGVISYEEAARYGKVQQKGIKKWKCYFVLAIGFLFVIFGAVFGLFLLGFQLTKETSVDENSTIHSTNALTTTDGNLITTVRGTSIVDNIYKFWDDDISVDQLNIQYIYGDFDNVFVHSLISYFIIEYEPSKKITFYDNSGDLSFELYKFANETEDGITFKMYQTLSNGSQIVRIASKLDSSSYSNTRRRLQNDVCDDACIIQFPESCSDPDCQTCCSQIVAFGM